MSIVHDAYLDLFLCTTASFQTYGAAAVPQCWKLLICVLQACLCLWAEVLLYFHHLLKIAGSIVKLVGLTYFNKEIRSVAIFMPSLQLSRIVTALLHPRRQAVSCGKYRSVCSSLQTPHWCQHGGVEAPLLVIGLCWYKPLGQRSNDVP